MRPEPFADQHREGQLQAEDSDQDAKSPEDLRGNHVWVQLFNSTKLSLPSLFFCTIIHCLIIVTRIRVCPVVYQ